MNIDAFIALMKVKAISDFQFGPAITDILFENKDNIRIVRSKRTNKIRYIYAKDNLLLTLRPTYGLFTLSLFSAEKIIKKTSIPILRAIVQNDISNFIKKGRNVFCKHVVEIDHDLRALDEIIVVNENDELLAIGRLKISPSYIRHFERGIAVIVRKGVFKSKT